MGVIVSKKVKRKIKNIFDHPNEVYSIYLNTQEDVVWVEGKISLYNFLRKLED